MSTDRDPDDPMGAELREQLRARLPWYVSSARAEAEVLRAFIRDTVSTNPAADIGRAGDVVGAAALLESLLGEWLGELAWMPELGAGAPANLRCGCGGLLVEVVVHERLQAIAFMCRACHDVAVVSQAGYRRTTTMAGLLRCFVEAALDPATVVETFRARVLDGPASGDDSPEAPR